MEITRKPFSVFNFTHLITFTLLSTHAFSQTETISTSLCGQTSPGSPCPGATNVELYDFAYNITSGNPAFTAINNFTTSGTYTAADITGFTLYVTNFCVFNTSTPLQTIPGTGPGTHTFTFADPLPAAPSQRYFWITTNFTAGAVPGRTITINLITAAMTAVTGTETYGTNTAGGTQTICTVLPMELVSFSAKSSSGKNSIAWTTATETNNDYFTLQKSTNGIDFTDYTRIKGAGNSNQQLNYEITDHHPFEENTYYRLQQTDFNGQHNYSEIIRVSYDGPGEIEFFPNPATEIIEIKTSSESPAEVKIMNALGQPVKEVITTNKKIDVAGLPPGLYLVYIKIDSQTTLKRVLKE
ncbi:MAG: T9SS type A sorting domain-containing protein [Flavobacteriales bacterium]